MTEPSNELRTVIDVRELLHMAELTDIVYFEVCARRAEDDQPEPGFSMNVKTRVEGNTLEVRCRAIAGGDGGEYLTDASAVFTLAEPIDVPAETAREFAEKVGVMAVYPYIRESMTQSGAKLGLNRPVLPLLRAGDVKLDPPEIGEEPDRDESGQDD